jgi:hypothetical protein
VRTGAPAASTGAKMGGVDPRPSSPARRLRRRRVASVAALVAVDLTIVALVRTSHRGTHIAESVLFPGIGLIENHGWLALAFVLAMVTATVLWLAWGADWLLGVVWLGSLVTTVALAPRGHGGGVLGGPLRGAHEFPLVVAATAIIGWLRTLVGRVPGVRRLRNARRRRRGAHRVGVVDTCRAASVAALAATAGATPDAAAHVRAIVEPRVLRRARRAGALARWRFTGNPLRADQAAIRTALGLWAQPAGAGGAARSSPPVDAVSAMCRILPMVTPASVDAEAGRHVAGVLASDAGWVRPLDAALAAAAARRRGSSTVAFEALLAERWALRRGHRPAWWYEPLGLAAGSAPTWEHAAASAVWRVEGWVGDDDWPCLRRAVLGAAARHDDDAHDERLVGAGRLWLRFVDDPEVAAIVARRSPPTDPLALALTQWAAAADPAGRPARVGVSSAGS